MSNAPIAVRLDSALKDKLTLLVNLRGLTGAQTNISEIIRDALDAYLDGAIDCLKEEALGAIEGKQSVSA